MGDREMLGVAACVIAGNCLRSGASFFLGHVSGTGKYNTTIWTMPEFVQDDVEDWLGGWEYKGSSSSESGSLHVDDFVAFSQYMSHYFKALGIEATPWLGLMEPPGGFLPGLPLDNQQLAKRYEEATLAAEAAYGMQE